MITIKRNFVIQVSPFNITVNGFHVAKTFKAFKTYCKRNGYTQADFCNWPFIETL